MRDHGRARDAVLDEATDAESRGQGLRALYLLDLAGETITPAYRDHLRKMGVGS